MTDRADFQDWAYSRRLRLDRYLSSKQRRRGEYVARITEIAWRAWQEAQLQQILSNEYEDFTESDSPKGECVPGVRYRLTAVARLQEKKSGTVWHCRDHGSPLPCPRCL